MRKLGVISPRCSIAHSRQVFSVPLSRKRCHQPVSFKIEALLTARAGTYSPPLRFAKLKCTTPSSENTFFSAPCPPGTCFYPSPASSPSFCMYVQIGSSVEGSPTRRSCVSPFLETGISRRLLILNSAKGTRDEKEVQAKDCIELSKRAKSRS